MFGWILLVPFVLLGVFLSVRWLGIISALILVIGVLAILSFKDLGPGTYAVWGLIGLTLLSVFALLTMWISAGAAWLVRKFVFRRN